MIYFDKDHFLADSEDLYFTIEALEANQWDALFGHHPFLSHAWFYALEQSGSIGDQSGWFPAYLAFGQPLVAATPFFIKTHSFGEFVFDFAWADAYHRHGLHYYPKAVSAIPFTPITGKRLASRDENTKKQLLRRILQICTENNLSSWHALFVDEEDRRFLEKENCLLRTGVQFHWHNKGWHNFADFLQDFSHDKRKKIKQERKKLKEAGITFSWKVGRAIAPKDWQFFYRCYEKTYLEHGHWPYLNEAFFHLLWQSPLQDSILLIEAEQHGDPVASAFFMFDEEKLYGRYWGCKVFVPGLHFETCYYQGIEFCLERKLKNFEAGAQGEHKLARGFSPVETHSAHWIKDEDFHLAIARSLQTIKTEERAYISELNERAPYKA